MGKRVPVAARLAADLESLEADLELQRVDAESGLYRGPTSGGHSLAGPRHVDAWPVGIPGRCKPLNATS